MWLLGGAIIAEVGWEAGEWGVESGIMLEWRQWCGIEFQKYRVLAVLALLQD